VTAHAPDARLLEVMAGAREAVATRITALAAATYAAEDADAWAAVRREAHKIAGTAGMVGLNGCSLVAAQLDALLGEPVDGAGEQTMVAAARSLARDLAHAAAQAPPPPTVSPTDQRPVLLVTLPAGQRLEAVRAAAARRGLRAVDTTDACAAVAVVLELPTDDPRLPLRLPPLPAGVPVIALAAGLDTAQRVRAVRAGISEVVDLAAPAETVIDAVLAHLAQARNGTLTVLAVDDDEVVLAAVRAVLADEDISLVTLADPTQFWRVLTESTPDLVVLDIDMPDISGLELCLAARADARWRTLPVLFLSGRSDPATVREVFAAGGDDLVTKPFVGPELRARILSRIDRVRLHRQLAETDPLTGLANRRKLEDGLARLTALAGRRRESMALAVADVDKFKRVNDEYGHDVGDTVLQHLARYLVQGFHREDIVARIGGEEFVVAMLGIDLDVGARRLAEVLAGFRKQGVVLPDGRTLHVSVSAGVSRYPQDGETFHDLYRSADVALRAAKSAGRGQVLAVGYDSPWST